MFPSRCQVTGRNIGVLPGIAFSLLPKLACPACWPAYAGLLSTLGLSFLLSTSYLLPLTGVFLLIAVAALAYRAPARRGYAPAVLGTLAAGVILVGKFQFESNPLMYAGLALLVLASIWNNWPVIDKRLVQLKSD
jgi:hypothetical protein